ncbi:MAG: tetratricopeptide repeat protein [Candidatus Pacebacteria bacterium]|nr:tetratricopeptide repeat protein [Candidatus Paceibacterota bacterium]
MQHLPETIGSSRADVRPFHRHACLVYPVILVYLLTSGLVNNGAIAQSSSNDAATPPETRYTFAQGLLHREFYGMAADELQAFLKKYPDHELAPRATADLVTCFREQKQWSNALETIENMHAQWPDHALSEQLYLVKGDILLKLKKTAAAAQSFTQASKSSIPAVREAALYFLAHCNIQLGNDQEAVTVYTELADKPFDADHVYRPFAAFALASLYDNQNLIKKAVPLYTRLAEETAHTPPSLREEAIYRLAELAFLNEKYAHAVAYQNRLLAEFPDGAFARETARRRIWACVSLENYDKAAEFAQQYQEQYDTARDHEFIYIFGTCLVGLERYERATTAFERVLDLPTTPQRYRRLAAYQRLVCLLKQKRYADTIPLSREWLDTYGQHPETVDVWYYAGTAQYHMEQYDKATNSLQKALSLSDGKWDYLSHAQVLLADSLDRVNKLGDAARLYRELARDADIANARYFLLKAGDIAEKADTPQTAIQDYRNIIEHAEGDYAGDVRTAALRLIRLYVRQNDFAKVDDLLQKMIAEGEGKQQPTLLLLSGYSFFKQGKYDAADKSLRQAVEHADITEVRAEALYYLTAVLLERDNVDEALQSFTKLFELPKSLLPDFNHTLLFRLKDLYYRKGNFSMSAGICRHLTTSPDPVVSTRASLELAQTLTAAKQLEEAEKVLSALRTRLSTTDLEKETEGSFSARLESLFGELYLMQGRPDQAVRAFRQALATPGGDMASQTRAHWGLAKIFQQEDRHEDSLKHAIPAFVMGNDPHYTPRAMLLAVQSLVHMGKKTEAQKTWHELRTRFPVFAEQHSGDKSVQTISSEDADAAENETITPTNGEK